MKRWNHGRRRSEHLSRTASFDTDEERWAGSGHDPLPSDADNDMTLAHLREQELAKTPGRFRAFCRKFLSPRWNASMEESLTEKTWGNESASREGPAPPEESGYKGEFSWVVVDNDLRLPGQVAAGDEYRPKIQIVEAEKEHISSPTPSMIEAQSPVRFVWIYGTRFLTDSLWPFLKSFVHMSFPDKNQERIFQHERWATSKAAACAGTFFLCLSTILSIAFTKTWTPWNYYAYLGIAGFFNLALPIMIACNTYVRSPWVYQVLLWCATWCWPFILAIEIRNCGFFGAVDRCGGRNFLNFFAMLSGVPTFALMTLLQNRAMHLFGITSWAIGMVGLFVGQPKANLPMWRNVILASVFHHILVWAAFFRERADRQLFLLRSQLKAQYRAVQAAQEMERRAQESKRQFFAYIFHEVRVPLNTARLALSNLHAEGAFEEMQVDQRDMIIGLDSSLHMMEKVLNDVLSFNKMEGGRLVFSRAPFSLHSAVNEAALLHRATAESTGLTFGLELDERIDALGAMMGDEMRVRQVCSNLLSNAFKFTQHGGVRLVTSLLHSDYTHKPLGGLKCTLSSEPEGTQADVVIRVEVHDTGAGLSLKDMHANRLFSPYVQTEVGRRQGGKGSGLGLALVTQIVKLSGGRLGVDSEPGKGSMFWFEMPFALSNERPQHAPPESSPLTFPARDSAGFPVERRGEPRFPLSVGSSASFERRESLASAHSASASASASPVSGLSHHGSLNARAAEKYAPRLPSSPTPATSASSSRRLLRHTPLPPVGLNTLVVDDDELTRDLMARTLRRLGHVVTTARDGTEALRLLKQGYEDEAPVDIVFLDNQMPAMSGVEVVRAVRALGWDVYIVGCTGNALAEDQEEYRNAGADCLIPKPVSVATIRERLELVRSRL